MKKPKKRMHDQMEKDLIEDIIPQEVKPTIKKEITVDETKNAIEGILTTSLGVPQTIPTKRKYTTSPQKNLLRSKTDRRFKWVFIICQL